MGVLIDLKKAFDTVNHKILIRKLEMYGVRRLAQKWLSSYLRNHKLHMHWGAPSALKTINVGVPQGSILGPVLFLAYKNDLPNVSKLFTSILYVDNTTLLVQQSTYRELLQSINDDLPKLYEWTKSKGYH